MAPSRQIEGLAIISSDGMIANSDGVMPPGLIVPADQVFFEQELDAADVLVHGRFSQETQARSALRRRIIVTRKVSGLERDRANERVLLWNPGGASFEDALGTMAAPNGRIAVIGGTDVFGLFLPLYTTFYLSRVPDLVLPGGRAVFPGVPSLSPEQILGRAGLREARRVMLDRERQVELATWKRSP